MKIPRIPQITTLLENIEDESDLGDISSYENPNDSFMEITFGPLGKYIPAICTELDLPLEIIIAPYLSGEERVDTRTRTSSYSNILRLEHKITTDVMQLPTFLEITLRESAPTICIDIEQRREDPTDIYIDVQFRCFGNYVIGKIAYNVSKDGKLEQYNDR